MNFLKIKAITKELGLKKVALDCDTSKLCSIGAGGRSTALVTIDDVEKLLPVIEALEKSGIKYIILGGGTNIVFGSGPMEYVLIKLGRFFKDIKINPKRKIEAGAGAKTANLVMKAAKNGFDLTFLAGIPGTIGGAVSGNSGTKGQWICSKIGTIKYIYKSGEKVSMMQCSGKKIKSGYRYLNIPGLLTIISIILEPGSDDPQVLLSKISHDIDRRRSSQPIGLKTAGCFFKNPSNTDKSAGALIEGCGLKSFSYGGARISPIHANFIENFSDASPEDIVVLSRIIKSKVKERYGIGLEYEVELIG